MLLLIGAGYAYFARDTYVPADSRFTGAYRFGDGRLAVVTPQRPGRFRLRFQNGQVRLLILTEDDAFEVFEGFNDAKGVVTTGRFTRSASGNPNGLELATKETATRLPLIERVGRFDSNELSLRGKLVFPAGPGPHPVVVTVHGSEDYSAVDYYYMPYFLAAHGIAALAYDKRGTGESTGAYTQDFKALAKDASAAARWASSHAEVDAQRINLLGFSQGGWIAPLAAQDIPGLRAIGVHFGVAVSVAREDRWGYVYELTRRGFGRDAIQKADEINAVMARIIDERDPAAWSDLQRLVAEHQDQDWFKAIAGSDSILGIVASTSFPVWTWRIYFWFQPAPSAPRSWDPAPALAKVTVPQHWILAGEDSSAPTPESVAVLEDLRAKGAPIDLRVFPDTEHGIVTFEEDEAGQRTTTGYAATYFDEALAWFKDKNAIAP